MLSSGSTRLTSVDPEGIICGMSHPVRRSMLDRVALAASALCLIDCTVLPLIAALAPVTGFAGLDHEVMHDLLSWVVVPLVSLALVLGYRRHRNARVLAAGALGLAMIVGGHHMAQPLAPLVGAVLLFAAQRSGHAHDGACCATVPVTLVLDRKPRG